MILTGEEIKARYNLGEIKISPFDVSQVTTNSYDIRLADKLLVFEKNQILDPKTPAAVKEISLTDEGYLLNKGDFVLGASLEKVGSDHFVPILHAKSGTARMGLFVHVTADLIDIGSYGNLTLQMYATLPVKIYPRMQIAQVTFWVPKGKITLYKGKYQGSSGPRTSMIYKDFLEKNSKH